VTNSDRVHCANAFVKSSFATVTFLAGFIFGLCAAETFWYPIKDSLFVMGIGFHKCNTTVKPPTESERPPLIATVKCQLAKLISPFVARDNTSMRQSLFHRHELCLNNRPCSININKSSIHGTRGNCIYERYRVQKTQTEMQAVYMNRMYSTITGT
jgi:hypothetical protein